MPIFTTKDMTAVLRDTAANTQPHELCIAWHRQDQQAFWGGKKTLEKDMREWRKMKRQNQLYINPEESREVKIDGSPWHILILHEGTPENPHQIGLDPLGFGIDDKMILVDGVIYFFKNKENRDMIVNYVMK